MESKFSLPIITIIMALASGSYAQKIKNNRINSYTLLPAASVFAPDAKSYFLDYQVPAKSNSSSELDEFKSIKKLSKEVRAVANASDADFKVEIVSPGISNVEIDDQHLYYGKDLWVSSPNNASPYISGYYKLVTYQFPCKVLIKDKSNTLLKTIIVNGDHETLSYPIGTKYFDKSEFEYTNNLYPFSTKEMLTGFIDVNKDKIIKQAEMIALCQAVQDIKTILTQNYKETDISKTQLFVYSLKDDAAKAQYPEIEAACQQQIQLMSDIMSKGYEACKSAFGNVSKVYETAISNQMKGGDLELLLNRNLVWSYILSGNVDKCQEAFNKFRMLETLSSAEMDRMYNYLYNFSMLERLTASEINAPLRTYKYNGLENNPFLQSAESSQSMTDKINQCNINRQEGRVVTTSGETFEGTVLVEFIKPREARSSGIVDLDGNRQKLLVWYKNQDGKEKLKTLFIDKVQTLVANGRQFEVVKSTSYSNSSDLAERIYVGDKAILYKIYNTNGSVDCIFKQMT